MSSVIKVSEKVKIKIESKGENRFKVYTKGDKVPVAFDTIERAMKQAQILSN